MCRSTDVIRLVLRATTTQREEKFACLVIDTYFERIIVASEQKLIAHGMRPFVTPIAAELALDRAEHCTSFAQYLAQLIDSDGLVADLVLQALRFYADRFATMDNGAIAAELKMTEKVDMNAAAMIIRRNLQFINPIE